ncbi:MAG: type II toxin-antitoxin system VapC family toxin [Gammaproteobacteria bacterium]|nr:type II toxin-antitoxin system VapC family toxin [Gammaproteobacteria bacterium]
MLSDTLRTGSRVFLDSAVLIYFLEENPRYLPSVNALFKRIAERGLYGIASYLTLMEVIVKPLKEKRPDLVERYRDILLNNDSLTVFPMERVVAEKAATLRASHQNLKTPDAIQLATAMVHGTDAFLTNDNRLTAVRGIRVIVLDDHI